MKRKQPPQHKHDCEFCTYLGRHHNFDLYVCVDDRCATPIARYGNNAWEYRSGDFPHDPALKEAMARARAIGIERPFMR